MILDPEDRAEATRAERAVSDVVAFTFVFSIIITSVGLVTVTGFSVLQDVQAGEQAINAQRGLETIGENINDIDRGQAPGRSGELNLQAGALYTRTADDRPDFEPAEITVTVIGEDGNHLLDENFVMGALYYELIERDTRIGYEGGAVFREDRDDAAMIHDAKFTCTDERAIVSIVSLRSDTDVPGVTSVQINAQEVESGDSLLYAHQALGHSRQSSSDVEEASAVEVSIRNSDFGDAWDRFFDPVETNWETGATRDYRCDADRISVRKTTVFIRFVT